VSTQTHTISEEPEPIDWQMLTRVLDSHDTGRPWTISELTDHFLDTRAARDSLGRLEWNGLIRKLGHHVIPTTVALNCRRLQRLQSNPSQLRLPL
jgi:hypothetical protein